MKRNITILLTVVMVVSVFLILSFQLNAAEYSGFKVEGRHLYDMNGDKFIPVGVNKMIIWTDKDGVPSYSEIAKTGANTVRIVWGIDGTPEDLHTAIYNCRANNMVPMIELHDATGKWQELDKLVDYWTRDDVVEVLLKHEKYLLLNIANECGDASISEADFLSGYSDAIKRIRTAGIKVPLIIDGTDWGKNIDILQSQGPKLIEVDPEKNVMFSVHMWWPKTWGYDEQRIIDEVAETVKMNLPLVVGEFGAMWEENEQGQIPYKTIMSECNKNEIGWLAWSWGPGNNPQTFLDMTDDSMYDTLHDWGLICAVSDPNSIKNTAKRPKWLLEGLDPLPTPTPLPDGNLALNKIATASSAESDTYSASKAVDGDLNTRWASQMGSYPQNLTIDLGTSYDIGQIIIMWENAYAKQYAIQSSIDGNTWKDIHNEYNGDGNEDKVSVSANARYIRISGTQRYNSEWGYSIWEVGVYKSGSETSVVTNTPTATPTQTLTTGINLTPSPSPSKEIVINYVMQNDWGEGATASVTIKNNSSENVNGWKLEWNFSGDQKIKNLWCGTFTQSGSAVTVSDSGWNGQISAGNSTNFGFNINYSGTNTIPTEFVFNGSVIK